MNDREAEKICNKWFTIGLEGWDGALLFSSKKIAIIKEEAWEKTFAKWYLIAKGHRHKPDESEYTCGLCNIYWAPKGCDPCPIYLYTEKNYCDIDIFYKAVGHDFGVRKAINVLEFISFLCMIARNE